MKKEFFDELDKIMESNPDVYILFGGLGWPRVDEFLNKYPDRAINCEASEQTMLDVAVGLCYAGKRPWCYTITPFLLRGFETIRTYIDRENLPVTLVGVGVNDEYSHDGFSHYAGDVPKILGVLKNIEQYQPEDVTELKQNMNLITSLNRPTFINIHR